ncbi:MAG TPA: glycine betaine ABC transporter substrate-binding protein, partial [Solirubrobacteraceae bacterium]|nr:glycine betaine ABC transporter substrate-binding protein [Solirubrobacteraceae bacterium]
FARAYHLRSLTDLARLSPTLTLGAPLQFTQNSTALPALESEYDLNPTRTSTVVIGDQYKDLADGKIEAAYVQTTDAQLATSQFRLLNDPKHADGFGNIIPVVTASTIAAEGPVFVDTLNRVDKLLTTRVLRVLNAQVDLDHMDPLAVAKQFLEQHGLVSASTAP